MLFPLIVFTIISCTTPLEDATSVVGEDQPLTYRQGFADGCGSGEDAAGSYVSEFKKDANEYTNNELYKHRWDDGYDFCKSKEERNRVEVDNLIEKNKQY